MKSNYSLPLWTILSLLGVIFILSPAQVGSAQDDDRLPATEEMHVIIVAGDKETPTHIPAPFSAAEIATRSQAPEAVPININYNPASCGGPISAWPAAARTAFEYAVDIWSLLFESGVIISIDACWRQDSTATRVYLSVRTIARAGILATRRSAAQNAKPASRIAYS